MRKIPLFAFILVSVSLLSGSYHQTSAIGIDSSSHGLLYGGRVVRRYGNLGNDKNLFNKRYPRQPTGLQVRQDQDDPPAKGAKGKGTDEDNSPKGKGTDEDNSPKAKGTDEDDSPKGKAAPKAKESPKEQPAKAKPKEDATKQPAKAKATPTPNQPNQQSPPSDSDDSDTTDTTTNGVDAASTANDQSVPSAAGAGTPTVATGGLSTAALAGLASIGGVFVLVAGLFAFGQRRKNKEMTKSIVSTSAKAWEQQNSTYEKMEEEAEPIGSYTVIATYTPTLADELDIQPGDKVTILVEFDDGWVQGVNETRGGTKGVFPRHCVDMDHVSSFRNNKRSSSMGVFSEKYTEVDLS